MTGQHRDAHPEGDDGLEAGGTDRTASTDRTSSASTDCAGGGTLHVPLPPEVPMPDVQLSATATDPARCFPTAGGAFPPDPGPEPHPEPADGAHSSSVGAVRRGPADPVRGLLHHHRELCERAVDPLEIAAGLEAHGLTDRTAARFRHRDVFSLAEELYARAPRPDTDTGATRSTPATPERAPGTAGDRLARLLLPLLPAALCAVTLASLARTPGAPPAARLLLAAAGAVGAGAAVRLALPDAVRSRVAILAALAAGWLTGFALLGTALPHPGSGSVSAQAGGVPQVALALACAVAPALWCARWFASRGRRMLPGSRSLAEFAAGVRPLLAAAVALFTLALLGALAAAELALGGRPLAPGTVLGCTALGVLLYVALLLSVHGYAAAAAAGLGAVCVAEVLALLAAFTLRLLEPASAGVLRTVTDPAAVPAAVCGCAAVGLLAYAFRALTRASAHQCRAAR